MSIYSIDELFDRTDLPNRSTYVFNPCTPSFNLSDQAVLCILAIKQMDVFDQLFNLFDLLDISFNQIALHVNMFE